MTTKRILFGEWKPDMPTNVGTEDTSLHAALNVYSSDTGYAPFPKAKELSEDMPDGLDINQLFLAKKDANILVFAGTEKHIYRATDTVRTFEKITDVSKDGGYENPAVDWKFAQFGDSILATNGKDKIQRYDIGGSTPNFADIDTSPVCETMAVVRDFVVAGYCYDDDTNKTNSNLVRWSDINNEEIWTGSDSNQAGGQMLPSGGEIKAITGGEFGLVLQESGITRMTYIGTPFVWQFDQISDNTGCMTGKSVKQYNGVTYFLSQAGFMACDGTQVVNIGAGKVNDWFFNTFNDTQLETIDVAIDPLKNLIIWNVPTNNRAASGEDRLLLMYNFVTGKWTSGITYSKTISLLASQGVSLDALDAAYPLIDDMPLSLDSPLFIGGALAFCGSIGGKIAAFTEPNSTAYLTTNDIESGFFSVATLARPIIEDGSAIFQIASRNKMNDTINFSDESVTSNENRADLRSGGRYHRVRVIPTGTTWKHAVGFDLDITTQGSR
jgi:hypothetical protein